MECFRFAWWNTRLRWKKDARQQEVARSVIQRLVDDEEVLVVALGEVEKEHAETLRQACKTGSLDLLLMGDAESRPLALLYRSDVFDCQSYRVLESRRGRKRLVGGLCARLQARDQAGDFHVFAIHWPSGYKNADASNERHELARDLRAEIHEIPGTPQVLILGDFNVEPFDAALDAGLTASRAREWVSKGRALLYNPFWRLLGEQQSLQEALQRPRNRKSAGTYWQSSASPMTPWYTMDQFLVSASLLEANGWHLWEDATAIWQEPPLLDEEKGRLHSDFDHFPIVGALRRS